MSDELITPLCHKLSQCLYLTTRHKNKFVWLSLYVHIRSHFVHVTNGVDFSSVRNATSAPEDFRCYVMMSKTNDFPKNSVLLFFLAGLSSGSTQFSIQKNTSMYNIRHGLPSNGPGFDSRLERCIYRASRPLQGTVNGGAVSK